MQVKVAMLKAVTMLLTIWIGIDVSAKTRAMLEKSRSPGYQASPLRSMNS